MEWTNVKDLDYQVLTEDNAIDVEMELISLESDLEILRIQWRSSTERSPEPFSIRWTLPAINVKGVWKTGSLYEKRLQADWELEALQSRISVDAPVICLFGHDDQNIQTFACSEVINAIELDTRIREEDNLIYCHLTFFNEKHPPISHYQVDIRIDRRAMPFDQALGEVAKWWEAEAPEAAMEVPPAAHLPLYSSWYNFHQNLSEAALLAECQVAKKLGYDLIIIDDGWQTMDSNRGYDYTGDWEAERLDLKKLVADLHELGMKVGLWYSVPFIGKKSKAYQKFKGKFLTEDHRWAPVVDPRYPEVRQYLIDIYVKALREWNLDAFKLDFIDDFKVYPDTVLTLEDGRDYANVNAGVERLMSDVRHALQSIRPDIVIEFRQKYIGPAMRRFGNMFRAFDCPNDSHTNRIRTTDVRLLSANSAVHSDPLTWHKDEGVELAALQLLNGFFAVPQLSVMLRELPEDHLAMVAFYTQYWKDHSDLIMQGEFSAVKPLAHYPILRTQKTGKELIGLYEDQWVTLHSTNCTDLINAKQSETVVLWVPIQGGPASLSIWTCTGTLLLQEMRTQSAGWHMLEVPAGGMLRWEKVTSTEI